MNAQQAINDWRRPPHPVSLRTGEVHIWRASLDLADTDLVRLTHTLSTDEQVRATRFCFGKDQRRFVAARGILRNILSQYLNVGSSQLSFSYGPSGKPALMSAPEIDTLCFNLSHSDGLALYAVALRTEVGIDLERIERSLAVGRIAESFFTTREAASLCALRPEIQVTAFFNCWTAKEAYLKANGHGIADGMRSFEVSLSPDGVVSEAAGLPYSLYMLDTAPEYAAALIVHGSSQQLRHFEWDALMLREESGTDSDRNEFSRSARLLPEPISETQHRA